MKEKIDRMVDLVKESSTLVLPTSSLEQLAKELNTTKQALIDEGYRGLKIAEETEDVRWAAAILPGDREDWQLVENKPTIVCLCGSTRFSEAYQQANLEETLAGKIVLTIGCDMHSDAHLFATKPPAEVVEIKENLDQLHLRKIDLADEILVLNVDGYVGQSTRNEIEYAKRTGKRVRWWNE